MESDVPNANVKGDRTSAWSSPRTTSSRTSPDAGRSSRSARVLSALVPVLFAACASGAGNSAEPSVTDSAGVEIVVNPGADVELPEWQVDSQPRVAIGVLEGEPEYQFYQVRQSMLLDDRLVVADGRSLQLRYFDLEGQHLRSAGGKGGGPGEFQYIGWLGRHDGDSVIVYDFQSRRFSVFDREGNFGRSFPPADRFFSIGGRLDNGSFVLAPSTVFSTSDGPRNGLVRDSARVIRVSATGKTMDTLMVVIGGQNYIQTSSTSGRVTSMSVRNAPFGLSTFLAVGDSLIYLATGDQYEIAVLDPTGKLVRSIRRPGERAPVSSADVSRFKEEQLASARSDDARRSLETTLAEMSYPEVMPAHGPLRVDDDGNLWVQEYSPWRDEPSRWSVYSEEGRVLGRVTLPARFTVHQLGSDFVLGVRRDEYDIEQVVIFPLQRSPSREIADARPAR